MKYLLTSRVSSLDHEVSDTPMKGGVVVIPSLTKQQKVVTGQRDHVSVQLHVQVAQ